MADLNRALSHGEAKSLVNLDKNTCTICDTPFANTQGAITHIRRVCMQKLGQEKFQGILDKVRRAAI